MNSIGFSSTIPPEVPVEERFLRSYLRKDYNNKSFLFVDPQIITQNSGFFSSIYNVCQIVVLLFSLFISINYINGGKVWFLVVLILSLLHVVVSGFMLSYLSEESGSFNTTLLEETIFGIDREYAKGHIRALVPFTHYFTVSLIFLLSVAQEIPLACIRTVGQCNLTVKKSVTLVLNIAFCLISLLILPQAYCIALYLVENITFSEIHGILFLTASICSACTLFLCLIKLRAVSGFSNAIEAELALRRAIVTSFFYIVLFFTTLLMTPWCSGLFEFEPFYELLSVLGRFFQIASIPIFVKFYVFAQLPFGWKKPLAPQSYTSPPGFDPGSLKETFQYALCLPITRPRPRKPEKVEVLPDFDEIPMSSVYPPELGESGARRAPIQFLAPPRAQTYRS